MAEAPIQADREALERAGVETELGGNLCIGGNFHIAETREQAIKEATPFFEEHLKMFGPLGFIPMSDDQLSVLNQRGGWDDAGLPSLESACEAGSWYCGPPEGFIDYIETMQSKYPGLDTLNVQSAMGTPEAVMIEQLEWFGGEVMPHFRSS